MHTPARRPLILLALIVGLAAVAGLYVVSAGSAGLDWLIAAPFVLAATIEAATKQMDDSQHQRSSAHAVLAGGQILHLPDGRAGAVASANANTGALAPVQIGDAVAYLTEGVFQVPKTAAIAILDGGPVYWDHSERKAHFRPGDDKDFFLGAAVGDAGASDSVVLVDFNRDPRPTVDLSRDPWTTALVAGGTIITRGPTQRLALSSASEAQKADALSRGTFALGANAIFRGRLTIVDNGGAAAAVFSIGLASATHATAFATVAEHVGFQFEGDDLTIYALSKDGTTTVNKTDTTKVYVVGTPFEVWIDARDLAAVKLYVEGVRVLSATAFKLDGASGPLHVLAHLVKSSNATVYIADVDVAQARTMDVI